MGHQFLKPLWRWRRRRWGWVGREWRCRRDRNLDRDFDRWLRDPFQDKVYMRSLLWSNLEELLQLLSPRSLSHPSPLSLSQPQIYYHCYTHHHQSNYQVPLLCCCFPLGHYLGPGTGNTLCLTFLFTLLSLPAFFFTFYCGLKPLKKCRINNSQEYTP